VIGQFEPLLFHLSDKAGKSLGLIFPIFFSALPDPAPGTSFFGKAGKTFSAGPRQIFFYSTGSKAVCSFLQGFPDALLPRPIPFGHCLSSRKALPAKGLRAFSPSCDAARCNDRAAALRRACMHRIPQRAAFDLHECGG
jgi:hypothetical protein